MATISTWKSVRKYGVKFSVNIYYTTGDDFSLPQFSDRYRGEWRDNAGWLKLVVCNNVPVDKIVPALAPQIEDPDTAEILDLFTALDAATGTTSGRKHGSTLASSVVAGVREVVSATVATDENGAQGRFCRLREGRR